MAWQGIKSDVKDVRGQVPDKAYTVPRNISRSALFRIDIFVLTGGIRFA